MVVGMKSDLLCRDVDLHVVFGFVVVSVNFQNSFKKRSGSVQTNTMNHQRVSVTVTRDQAYRACASRRFADTLSGFGQFDSLENLLEASRDVWFGQVRPPASSPAVIPSPRCDDTLTPSHRTRSSTPWTGWRRSRAIRPSGPRPVAVSTAGISRRGSRLRLRRRRRRRPLGRWP